MANKNYSSLSKAVEQLRQASSILEYRNNTEAAISSGTIKEFGILNGDILIYETKILPRHGNIVIVSDDDDFADEEFEHHYLIKRFNSINDNTWLSAGDKDIPDIKITPFCNIEIIGVIKKIVRDVLFDESLN